MSSVTQRGCLEAPEGTRVVVHQTAVGDSETELLLTFQARMLAGSSLVPQAFVPKDVDKVKFVRAMYLDGTTLGVVPTFPTRLACKFLGVSWLRIPAFLTFLPLMMMHQIQQRMSGNRQGAYKTPVRTLSSMLEEQGLRGITIDLLKVDVEGGVD